jgi:enterochelin esterase family protein
LTQSGSYHWGRDEEENNHEWLIREFAFNEKKPLRIYMEVGTLEGEYSWRYPEFPHQLVSHRHFKTVLDMKGYDSTYVEYGGGHEMLSWRGGIADGLKLLLKDSEPD